MTGRRPRADAPPVVVYTVAEAAQLMRVSRATAYRMVRDGALRFVKARGLVRIPADAITEWAAKAS